MPFKSLVTQAAPRRFVLAFVIAAVLLLVPAIAASLYFGLPVYDLVRVGHLPQRDYGAQVPSMPLERIAAPAAGERTDVVVLGDSFSLDNLWQSEFTRLTGQRVATWHFNKVRCTSDWIDKAMAGNLRAGAKIVIVQSAEREFLKRFRDKPGCARDFYPQYNSPVGTAGLPYHWWDIFPMDIGYLAKVAMNYPAAHRGVGRYRSGKVVVVDLVRPDLFTHLRSTRLLYYTNDELKFSSWSDAEAEAVVARMAAWRQQASAAGITLVFLAVPDKSSVYWPWIKPDQQLPYPEKGERLFTLIGEQLGPQYNLLSYLREQAVVLPDLYGPDDSHFSTAGYRLLAARVALWTQAPLRPDSQPGN